MPLDATRRIRRGAAEFPSNLDRHEMIDGDQDDQQQDAKAEAEPDQFLFNRQQRLDFRIRDLVSQIG
jgi:hypothetical protein